MATLSPASAAAIARLRAYVPPPTQFYNLPLARRAAVLILLFADRKGDLRVVLTIRASTLKTYAGQAAFPGGKADSLDETPFDTARREAYEEIGLPLRDAKLPHPYRVEHLTEIPANLAKTELVVRPCVAFLSPTRTSSSTITTSPTEIPDIETSLIPRLDAKEVAAVFSAPFHSFLRSSPGTAHASTSASSSSGTLDRSGPGIEAAGFPSAWYRGQWTDWHESRWRMHNFYVPVDAGAVAVPKPSRTRSSSSINPYPPEGETTLPERFRVFGMTARILVDCARVAYAEDPDFEHNSHFGDEEMIERLLKIGRLSPVRREGEELTREVLRQAAGAKM